MKRTFLILVMQMTVLTSIGQHVLRGRILEKGSEAPIPNATVTISPGTHIVSDERGIFLIKSLKSGDYLLEVSSIGYRSHDEKVNIPTMSDIDIYLEKLDLMMQPVEIRGVRAGDKAPFTKTNLSKREIEKVNMGQDLPFVLHQLPSVIVNSDAGNGVGYTGIRIRGTDATRINVTLNGIPYNDAESQGTFFVDLPDFTSSVSSIQVQRGAGTSSNGSGAFGATINMSTNEFIDKAYGESNNVFGSFNTWKNTLKAGTGLLNDKFTVDARLSSVKSDGYIDRASSDLKSFYLSGAYFSDNSSLRLNIFSGKAKTYQAWNGVPENMLITNRTYNSAGTEKPGDPYANETDNYQQDHYQLFYNRNVNSKLSFNVAAFLSRGKGYYEQYKASKKFTDYGLPVLQIGDSTIYRTDLIRQLWLDNHYYGSIFSLQYNNKGLQWLTGGGWNRYDGKHYGKIIWANYQIPKDYTWYDVNAFKTDFNIYSKIQYPINSRLYLFGDIQYRNVRYQLNGFRDNPDLFVDNQYHFINPKAGVTYSADGWTGYFSYALANKEPNRDDFEASATQQPKPETLHDFELGIERRVYNGSWGAALYYMNYHDQLVLTGKINDVGAYVRTNIPNSYRIGIELQGKWQPVYWFNSSGNIAFSRNRVKNYTAWYDDFDSGGQKQELYKASNISFSPAIVGNALINFIPKKDFEISLMGKYVSQQYLDNTGNESRKLGDL